MLCFRWLVSYIGEIRFDYLVYCVLIKWLKKIVAVMEHKINNLRNLHSLPNRQNFSLEAI